AIGVAISKAVNAADPFHPTVAEDADTPATAPHLAVGSEVVWTYLVTATGPGAIDGATIVVRDDHGTATPDDDFLARPVLDADGVNLGDSDRDGLLDPGERWLYTSAGVRSHTVVAGPYANTATVTAFAVGDPADPLTASDANHHVGSAAIVAVEKAVNAADPLAPTAADDADHPETAKVLAAGSPLVWTYLITDETGGGIVVVRVRDDNGTPDDLSDDFSPVYVSGEH